jgi:hypothetical protein
MCAFLISLFSDGMEKLVQNGLVKPLAKNFSHPDPTVGVNALRSIVVLSSQGTPACTHQCLEELMQAGGINRLAEVILSMPKQQSSVANGKKDNVDVNPVEAWKKRVNFAMAILANLTRSEEGAVELVGKTLPEKAVAPEQLTEDEKQKLPTKPLLELMLSRFLREDFYQDYDTEGKKDALVLVGDEHLDSDHRDPYQHFAAVLMNCAQTESARKFVLKIRRKDDNDANPTSVIQAVLPQLKSANRIRRRGIAGTIRNCCLETETAWWFLNVVKLTKHILYPLAGPEELELDEKKGLNPDLWLEGPDKVREPDDATRLYLVESILLLCASGRKSRESLRLERVYVILKWADMVEENEEVSEGINECVQFLRRDEQGTTEGSSDSFVEKTLKPSTALEITMLNENYDDVD